MDLLLAFVLAMSVTMAMIPALIRVADRMHIVDMPGPRKVHARPVPRIGGIAMVVGAMVPLLVWLEDGPTTTAYLGAALLLVGFGVWDDRAALGYLPKLVGQLLAALIVVVWGGVLIHSVTLTERFELPYLVALPLTVLFLVGSTNAINLADGLDGLAGGTTLLSCCAIALLGLTVGDLVVATVAIVVAGSLLGFLRYNTYPARIFMGDGGSQFLGFTVAVVSILLTQGASGPFSAALPLLLLGLPILDTLMVMVQRIHEGRSPFAADKNHIHHRLLALGFDHHEAVIVIYVLQAVLFVTAWYMRYESDLQILMVFGAYALVVLGSLFGASRVAWRWRRTDLGVASSAAVDNRRRGLDFIRQGLPGWALLGVGAGAGAYALYVAAIARPITADVGWLALLLSGFLLVIGLASLARPSPAWILHGSLYIGAVVLVYLEATTATKGPGPGPEIIALGLMAVSTMLYFRLTTVRRFRLSPLDFLVIFVALALPNLPGSIATPRELGVGAVKLLVLFYAIEMLLVHSSVSRISSHVVATAALALLAYRALT